MTSLRPAPADGLDALRAELSVAEITRLIERTAQWVDPETYRRLPVWYPEHSRRGEFYKSNWSEPQLNRNLQTGSAVHKREGNLYANKALTRPLRPSQQKPPELDLLPHLGVRRPNVLFH